MQRLSFFRRPARARRWWLWLIAAVVVLAVAGPSLVGFTPLPASILAGVLPADAGRLTARSTSLSWTGPVAVAGLELRDPQGTVVFSADRVELAGGLLGLAAGKGGPLYVRVEGPRVDLVVSPQGTNFDRIVQALSDKAGEASQPDPANPQPTPLARRPLTVQVVGAAARITDHSTGAQWLVDEVNVDLADPARGVDAIELTAAGKLSAVAPEGTAAPPRGEFAVRLGAAQQGGRLARVKATAVPLSLFDPLLKLTDPTASVTGWASVEGDAAWRPLAGAAPVGTSPAEVLRSLVAGGVRSTGAAHLTDVVYQGVATQGGPVSLAMIDGPWRLAAEGAGVAIQQLDLTSEVGSLTVTGSVVPAEAERWTEGVPAAPRDMNLTARVDLERLAAVAPQLVRLRQDARVDSGRVEATAVCQQGRVAAKLSTGPLAGVAEGRRIEWREPIEVRVAATQDAPTAGLAGWALESFNATSTFFQAQAGGDATRIEGNAEFDLDQLAKEVAQLIELGQTRLAGTGKTRFVLERDEATRRWRLESRGGVEGLFVGTTDAPLAREQSLNFVATLAGSLDTLQRPPVGTINLTAGEDTLVVTLPDASNSSAQPFEVRLSGDAARWMRRAGVASPGLPSPEAIALAGGVELTAAGVAGSGGGRLDRFNLALTGLAVDTAGLDPSTPRLRLANERVEASGLGTWNTTQQAVQFEQAQVISSVASANLRDVLVSLQDPASSRGELAYQVDLTRLNNWTPPRGGPARYAASGAVEGTARLRGVPEGLQVLMKSTGRGLTIVDRRPETGGANPPPGPQTIWTEPQLVLDSDVMVTPIAAVDGAPATYAVEVRNATIDSQTLTGSFGGRIADLVSLRGVEMGGGVDYDLEKLTPMLWPQLGDGVRLVGRDRAKFRIATDDTAPVDAAPVARLRAYVEAPWQSADLFGLPVGAGRLAATLERGAVRVDPLDVAIGGGRLTASAIATLDPPPAVLTVPPGPLVTNVAMSQEVNERVLKFIAPVLADATRIEGRFSVTLRELAVPLATPPTTGPPPGRAAGVLDIHQVRVMPGPAVAEWVALVKQIAGAARDGVESVAQPSDSVLVAIDNNQVDFQMVDGRVYHRGLQFYVGDAVVQSTGSVGVDESLDLLLAVPILDAWIERRPTILGRMRGQALRIPIQGTLSRPKINNDAFKQLSGQLLQSAAAGAIEKGLNSLFKKLQ